ncbi:MAG: hypothetical protein JWL69_5254 [Phycisphaerales bacterium]|nr:hypothetical protein [Phycisphaerales bacterium]
MRRSSPHVIRPCKHRSEPQTTANRAARADNMTKGKADCDPTACYPFTSPRQFDGCDSFGAALSPSSGTLAGGQGRGHGFDRRCMCDERDDPSTTSQKTPSLTLPRRTGGGNRRQIAGTVTHYGFLCAYCFVTRTAVSVTFNLSHTPVFCAPIASVPQAPPTGRTTCRPVPGPHPLWYITPAASHGRPAPSGLPSGAERRAVHPLRC